MTVTNKLIKQYFLERSTMNAASTGGYYYGSSTVEQDPFNVEYESIELDEVFNPNTSGGPLSIALQPDGKIIIGGTFTSVGGVTRNRIARLNFDGTLDAGFDPNLNNSVSFIAVQPDGKILIGGSFTSVGGVGRNKIARLNSDGTLDTSFNPNANNGVVSVALQPDGKIIIGGFFSSVGGVTRNRIARLYSDGTLDTGFDPNVSAHVESIALQPDGKILIGGGFPSVGGVTRNSIARLNSDGTLDEGFDPNPNALVRSIALQPDGKILIGGEFSAVGGVTRNKIARLYSDGTLDAGFDPNVQSDEVTTEVDSVVIQPDGKIIIIGGFGGFTSVGGVTRNNIARLNSDGTLDIGFNPNPNERVVSVALQPDGKIVIGGFFSSVGGVTRNFIVRLKEVVDNAPYKLIYTVPSGTNLILESFFVTNHNDFIVSYDVAIVPYADENVSEKHYFKWDELIEANSYNISREKPTLYTGDKIYVYSSTDENMSFNVFGSEITS